MASEKSAKHEIHIKISAENGNQILKEKKIDVYNICNKNSEDTSNEQASSYLKNLSDTLKSLRHETNSLLTQYIENTSNSNAQKESEEVEISEDDDMSDNDNTG